MSEPIPAPELQIQRQQQIHITDEQQTTTTQQRQLDIQQTGNLTLQGDQTLQTTMLATANASVSAHMPPSFAGNYVAPTQTLQTQQQDGSSQTYSEQNEFGEASLSMHSEEFSTQHKPSEQDQKDEQKDKKKKTPQEQAIDKTVENLLGISTNFLKAKMDTWGRDGQMPYNISLTIRGSYQLSDVTDLAAAELVKWVNKNYPLNPDFVKYIKFNLIKNNPAIEKGGEQSLDMEKKRETSGIPYENVEHTLVYSATAKDDLGYFQEVLNADKFILTENDSGLGMAEKKLTSLENGIHFMHKDGKFVEIDSLEQAKAELDSIKGMKKSRKDKILAVVEKYLNEHVARINLSDADAPVESKDGKPLPPSDPKGDDSVPTAPAE